MSHSLGIIKFTDNSIRYFEYDGTSDVCVSSHYATIEEVHENWRSGKWNYCQCGKEESVSIYSSYGGGFYFDGVACRTCNSVDSDNLAEWIIEELSEAQNHWAKAILNKDDDLSIEAA